MKKSRWIFAFLCAALFLPRLLCAGTLDDAPFRVVLPNAGGWQILDSTAKPLGQGAFVAATITNASDSLRSLIITAPVEKQATLNGICVGLRQSLVNQGFNIISDADTMFLGYESRTFTLLSADPHGQTRYSRVTTFIANGKSWTIVASAPSEQKEMVRKFADFFVKKK